MEVRAPSVPTVRPRPPLPPPHTLLLLNRGLSSGAAAAVSDGGVNKGWTPEAAFVKTPPLLQTGGSLLRLLPSFSISFRQT